MPAPSPELLRRIDAIDGCNGRWIVDNRAVDGDYSYAFRSLGESVPCPDGRYHRVDTAKEAAELCAAFHWRGPLLLWQSTYLNADCSWPGGYSAPSIYRSNYRVFVDEHRAALEAGADGDGPGLSLDVRYVTDGMIEALQSLEQYPLLSEDDLSELALKLQDEAWESWAEQDWRGKVTAALATYAPGDTDPDDWAESHLDKVEPAALFELFVACADSSNTYWEEDQGDQWIDLNRVATALNRADLVDLTGLQLLSPDQVWRREPYPWPGADPSPLVEALPSA